MLECPRLLRRRWLTIFFILAVATTLGISAQAQTLIDLHDFNNSGSDPQELLQTGAIPQGKDGKLYGISHFGGTSNIGTVFSMTLTGTPTIITSLDSTTGAYPYNGLTLGSDGNFYGAAPIYGSGNLGTVFKVTPSGILTVLHAFTNSGDGGVPVNPPAQGTDGNYYGLASGNSSGGQLASTFYKVSATGTFTTIHTFDTNSEGTQCAAVTLGTDGSFYGSCGLGGSTGLGTLFKITPAGKVTVLHTFAGTDGKFGSFALALANDGNFYGVTNAGGAKNAGVLFQLKPTGAYRVLHNFTGGSDGGYPLAGLTAATDGNLYGTTANGGNTALCPNGFPGCGVIFKSTLTGNFTVLYTFDITHGEYPESNLTEDTNGLLYGNTLSGGQNSAGIFYSLDVGLQPYASLQQTSGKAGTKVGILGQGFSASSVVKFNGMQATAVQRQGSAFLQATVPAGASTGLVTVTTGSTTLTSSKAFLVHDSWSSGAAIPIAVQAPATGVIAGKIYVVGGATNTAVTANNQIYNPATNTWTTGAPMPTARFVAASAVVNNVLYVIGGNTNGSSQTGVVEAYNPTTDSWSTKSAMPTARDSIAAVVEGGIIYVIGGFNAQRLATVESYNPKTDSWTEESPMLVAKSQPAAGLLGTTIVAAGGLANNGQVTGDNEGYNAAMDSWSTLTADPTPRQSSCYASIAGLLYSASGTNGTPLTVNEAYNASSKKWLTLAAIPSAVVSAGGVASNNVLYCIGGSDSGIFGEGTVYNLVQIYQP